MLVDTVGIKSADLEDNPGRPNMKKDKSRVYITVVKPIYLISTYSEDILQNSFSQKKKTSQELTCNREYDSVISSNEVCIPIPVTFSKFGGAKIRTEKLPIQDSMIKLGTKYGISRRVSRLVLTLSLL